MQVATPTTIIISRKQKVLVRGDVWKNVRRLGRGAHGAVWLRQRVRYKGTAGTAATAATSLSPDMFAFKRMANMMRDHAKSRQCLRELQFATTLCHPNIVTHHRIHCQSRQSGVYLQMEAMSTSLAERSVSSEACLGDEQVRYLIYQLLCSVNYLHSGGILHRDIKPQNLLVNDDNTLKLCDMGLACYVPHAATLPADAQHTQHTQQMEPHVQTRWYRAPEVVLLDPHYGTSADIWSCGAVLGDLFEMQLRARGQRRPLFPGRFCYPLSPQPQPPNAHCTADTDQLRVILDALPPLTREDVASVRNPIGKSMLQQQQQQTLSSAKPQTPSLVQRFHGVNPQALDLLHHMLHFQPQQRWTAAQCLAHPYFAPVRREFHREMTYAHIAHDEEAIQCFCFQCTESRPLSFADTKTALEYHVQNDNPNLDG